LDVLALQTPPSGDAGGAQKPVFVSMNPTAVPVRPAEQVRVALVGSQISKPAPVQEGSQVLCTPSATSVPQQI
jgi:hypothetical protein